MSSKLIPLGSRRVKREGLRREEKGSPAAGSAIRPFHQRRVVALLLVIFIVDLIAPYPLPVGGLEQRTMIGTSVVLGIGEPQIAELELNFRTHATRSSFMNGLKAGRMPGAAQLSNVSALAGSGKRS